MRRSNPITTQRIVELKGKYGPEALPAITARVAREELAKVQAVAPAPYTQTVDGRQGAPLESVRPGGIIVFRFNRIGDVFDWIYEQLLTRSPVGPDEGGHYRDDHWVFVNGEKIEVPEVDRTIAIAPGAEVVIVDVRPYARKIEQGESLQAPDGVYEITAYAARRKFPHADVGFTYRGFLVNSQQVLRSAAKKHAERRAANQADKRYPCIVLRAPT